MNPIEGLACWALGCSHTDLYVGDYEVNQMKLGELHKALDSYARGVPVQYIMGETEFMGLKFKVNPSVLIPRPETEILVEMVLKLMEKELAAPPYILDLGTGSGAIAVSLTKYSPLCKMLASDISKEALSIAQINALLNGVSDRIEFILADLFDGIAEDKRFDLIVSNPPYIPSERYQTLPVEVKAEPRIALDAGKGGLRFYEEIIPESAKRLEAGGYLALEMGADQSRKIEKIAEKTHSFSEIRIDKDYSGIERILLARKPNR